jgi:hypothetical protein
MTTQIDPQRARRDLRLRIGRLRRRIDRRIRALEREGRRLASWRTYVRRYPAHAVLAAMGLGLAVSAGPRGGWGRQVGMHLLRRMGKRGGDRIWSELERIWRESKPEGPPPEPGGA